MNETTTPSPDNPCQHWDHCDCESCLEDCDELFQDLHDIVNATEEPDAG